MNRLALLRYNFRVLMFNNWWLLVIPLAASQLTVFWNIITQRFAPTLPAQSVEMVSPLLAAFLSAHLLTAEYRSGIGAILASKPVDTGKVVLLRLAVALLLVWALAGLSLAAYYYGMEPYDYIPHLAAGAASTLFLAMLALLFATLLRHPLAGFGIAVLYWAMDLPPGPPLHPLMSLRSLDTTLSQAAVIGQPPLPYPWWSANLALLVGALVLYLLHSRLLFTLGTPQTARSRRRAIGWAGALLAFYLLSGAVLKVAYGYAHRGQLFPDDISWFRRQFAPYGPMPVSALFGSSFRKYIGEIPNAWRIQQDSEADSWGDTIRHRRELAEVVQKAPDSLWAPSAAELLARLEAPRQQPVEKAVAFYRHIVDRYPNSPYVPFALQRIGSTYADAGRETEARAAFEQLLVRGRGTRYETDAFRFLAGSDRKRGDLAGAEKRAHEWAAAAPVYDRFNALLFLAQTLRAANRPDEAHQAAQQALEAVRAYHQAERAGTLSAEGSRKTKWERDAATTEDEARKF